jgi:hypothetical protein
VPISNIETMTQVRFDKAVKQADQLADANDDEMIELFSLEAIKPPTPLNAADGRTKELSVNSH